MFSLLDLQKNKYARIVSFSDHILTAACCTEMGLCQDSIIQLLDKLPFGGNLIILSKNGKYTLRKRDASHIMVEEVNDFRFQEEV